MTNIESNTALKDKPEGEAGTGEELLYRKSNLVIEGVKNGAVRFA
jgi:hypothetical protein